LPDVGGIRLTLSDRYDNLASVRLGTLLLTPQGLAIKDEKHEVKVVTFQMYTVEGRND